MSLSPHAAQPFPSEPRLAQRVLYFLYHETQRTTEFLADTGDIFTAMLTGGGVRVYMRNKGGIDLPASHPLFAEAVAQTDKTVEAFFDSLIERGVISLRDIK